jgi:arylsulfatase
MWKSLHMRPPRFGVALTLGLWAGFLVGLAGGLLELALHGYASQGLWLNALRTLSDSLLRACAAAVLLSGAAALAWSLRPRGAALAVYGALLGLVSGIDRELDLRETWWITDLEIGGLIVLLLLLPIQLGWPRRALPVRSVALPVLVLAATLGAEAGLGAARRAAHPDRLNVVLLLVDTLRADHVSALGYGRPTSPTLDRLAAEGVLFTRAISPAAATRPAMVSLWTGLYPSRHRVARRVAAMNKRFVTGAELAREAGYRTAAFCPNPNLDRKFGYRQGWDVYVDRELRTWQLRRDAAPWARYETANHVQERALRFIDADPERPFLLWLHYRDVHGPYLPPPPYDRRFRSVEPRPLTPDEVKRRKSYLELPDDGNDLNHYVDQYDGEVRYTDARIADFLEALEHRGLRQRTVLIVAADHGEEFLDHGDWHHGQSLYEEMVHVPFIIVWPEGERRVEPRPVSTLSFFATLAGIVGVEPPASDGVDLGPLLRGEGEVAFPPVVLSQKSGGRGLQKDGRRRLALTAVRQGDWKLVVDEGGGHVGLFDLAADPGEQRDRLEGNAALAGRLAGAAASLGAGLPSEAVSSGPDVEIDPELRESLRELGSRSGPAS